MPAKKNFHAWNVSTDKQQNLTHPAEYSLGQQFPKVIILRELLDTLWEKELVYYQVLADKKVHVTHLPPQLGIITSVGRGHEISHRCQG